MNYDNNLFLGVNYDAIENTYCEYPLGKSISSATLFDSLMEAENACDDLPSCKMFYATVDGTDQYFLCPLDSVIKTKEQAKLYVKGRKSKFLSIV